MVSSVGNPGSREMPLNPSEKTIVKKMGITSDGMNVEGRRGIRRRLRRATAVATRTPDTLKIPSPAVPGEPGSPA
jgi:hypothetical protein